MGRRAAAGQAAVRGAMTNLIVTALCGAGPERRSVERGASNDAGMATRAVAFCSRASRSRMYRQ